MPQVGTAMGFLLQIKMSWLRALSKGCRCWCWCCGPGCWCCELAERAFKTGGGAGRVLVSADCARCRKLAAQAACILVPASRMSTGRGILPNYQGLCWCNCTMHNASLVQCAMHSCKAGRRGTVAGQNTIAWNFVCLSGLLCVLIIEWLGHAILDLTGLTPNRSYTARS